MENQTPYLKAFLLEKRVELYEKINDLKDIQIKDGLNVVEEMELNCLESKLEMIKQVISICENRKRY